MTDRTVLEARWLRLTREELPALAEPRGWPVRFDHCFQRILLDNACGGRWYDHVAGRPAYRRCDEALLARAVALGEAVASGEADLHRLNRRSLAWRGTRGAPRVPPGPARPAAADQSSSAASASSLVLKLTPAGSAGGA